MEDSKITDRGRATRARIVEATAHQILAAGIGGTTLDTVRAATLTSKSQLFHYFPGGKAELVREVAAWEAEQLLRAQRPHLDHLDTWESWRLWRQSLVDYYLGLGRWACPIGSLASQSAATDPELADTVGRFFVEWQNTLVRGIGQMQQGGLVEASAEPARIAVTILAAIQGGLLLSQPIRSAWPLEAALDSALDALKNAAVRSTAG